jgi:polyhydroxyalkanoate synthesis regulator phasin
MTESNKESLKEWGGELIKWVATSMIALCVYFANQIRDDVEEAQQSISIIEKDLAVAKFQRMKIDTLEGDIDEIERRVRELERSK